MSFAVPCGFLAFFKTMVAYVDWTNVDVMTLQRRCQTLGWGWGGGWNFLGHLLLSGNTLLSTANANSTNRKRKCLTYVMAIWTSWSHVIKLRCQIITPPPSLNLDEVQSYFCLVMDFCFCLPLLLFFTVSTKLSISSDLIICPKNCSHLFLITFVVLLFNFFLLCSTSFCTSWNFFITNSVML